MDPEEKNAFAAQGRGDEDAASELVPLPDRLRPMTSITGGDHDEDNQTIMSEVTLPLQVRGTLYPNVSSIPDLSLEASPLESRASKRACHVQESLDSQTGISNKTKGQENYTCGEALPGGGISRPKDASKDKDVMSSASKKTIANEKVSAVDPGGCLGEEENSPHDGDSTTECFLRQVAPLPTSSRQVPHAPGAHAIYSSNPSRTTRPPQASPPPRSTTTSTNDVFDATVVDENEDLCQRLEQGDAATLDMPITQSSNQSRTLPNNDDEDMMVIDGKILKENGKAPTRRTNRNTTWALSILLLVAVVALVVILVSLVGRGSSGPIDDKDVDSPTSIPTTIPLILYPPFQETFSLAIQKSIENIGSPFYFANKWMLEDPYLNIYSEARQKQRFYLAMLYYATNGDQWLHNGNWMSYEISECSWYTSSSFPKDSKYYVPSICNENGALTSLSLAQNNLTGSVPLFPPVLLPHLQVLDLDGNHLSGEFPPVVPTGDFKVFIISNNRFTGRHRGHFNYKNLVYVRTDDNQMSSMSGASDGRDSAWALAVQNIEFLSSNGNFFEGTIASELGLCTKLTYLSRGTLMSGSIPSELGLLSKLTGLDVSNNNGIDGTIPTELGSLPALAQLDISGTSISGPIPDGLCDQERKGSLEIVANCSMVDCCE